MNILLEMYSNAMMREKGIVGIEYQCELLKSKRLSKGMTQQQTANAAGISIQHYQLFETGKRYLMRASYDVACRVLESLELDIDDFYKKNQVSEKNESTQIKTHREAAGLTQEQVADAAGITLQQYQKIEEGTKKLQKVSFETACQVLEVLKIAIV